MADYSEELIKKDNPWRITCNYVNPNPDKLYDDKAQWLLKCDADIVNQFNEKNNSNPDVKFELGLRPEPFNGNPLKAKVIILSLNPGYVVRVNNLFAKVLQTTIPTDTQEAVKEQKNKQLRLEAESFFCSGNSVNRDSVSYQEAHCMLDDWYWYDIFDKFLKEAKEAKYLPNDYTLNEMFNKVALVQYIGYMSKSYKPFTKGTILPSQMFTKKLIEYIALNKKDVLFVISRSENKWESLIDKDIWDKLDKEENRLVHRATFTNKLSKQQTIRTQGFSQKSFKGEGFEQIARALI